MNHAASHSASIEETIRKAEELLDLAERRLELPSNGAAAQSSETEIILIADRSGSMEPIAADMEGGLHKFLRDQEAADGRAFLTACLFDDRYEVLCVSEPLTEARTMSIRIVPRGSTALLDAVGRTLCEAIHTIPRDRLVVVLIVTDGHENASREFSHDAVNRLIDRCRERLGWQFIFLGAGENQMRQARDMRIGTARALQTPVFGPCLRRAMHVTSDKVARYRYGREISSLDFTDEEREAIEAAS